MQTRDTTWPASDRLTLPPIGLLAGARRRRGAPRDLAGATAISPPPPNPEDRLLERLLGTHVSPELLGLWLIEVTLCAAVFCVLLSGGGEADHWSGWLRTLDRAVALAVTFGITSAAVGLYSPDTYQRTRGLLFNTAIGALLAWPAIWLVGHLVGLDITHVWVARHTGAPALALKALLGWILLLFALRLTFSYALRANLFTRRVLVLGDDEAAARIAAAIEAEAGGFFDVAGVLTPAAAAALTPRRLRRDRIRAVILTATAGAALPSRQLARQLGRGVRLYSDSEFWERRLRRIDVAQSGPDWRRPAPRNDNGIDNGIDNRADSGTGHRAGLAAGRGGAAAQRLADIVLSLTLLAATLPLMLLTAMAIACESRGPVLYRQERVGLRGRTFTLTKFRSMRPDAEARGPVWAARRDPRVTRVGAFIRLTRIDELPQLLCVLRGEMGFIGPRPERPHFVAQLEQVLPFYRDRLLVKPGLTGWAQVNCPYGASVEDARTKLSYDLYYVKHRGLRLDLMILLATVRVVLFQRGAR